ncbi:MAG: hypothetical protein II719_01550 [Clostridia bacterium]|nr:hypothetical protein [Clostridia bacterium]
MDCEQCLSYVIASFYADTVELLGLVLSDDDRDPSYSAVTALNRLFVYLQLERQRSGDSLEKTAGAMIREAGFSAEDADRILQKARREYPEYHGEIFDQDFLFS